MHTCVCTALNSNNKYTPAGLRGALPTSPRRSPATRRISVILFPPFLLLPRLLVIWCWPAIRPAFLIQSWSCRLEGTWWWWLCYVLRHFPCPVLIAQAKHKTSPRDSNVHNYPAHCRESCHGDGLISQVRAE